VTSPYRQAVQAVMAPARRQVFGESVTITPFGGDPVAAVMPFSSAYTREEPGMDGVPIQTTSPAAGPTDIVYLAGLGVTVSADPETRTRLAYGGTDYDVDEVRPDGFGSVMLILAEV
jgi:hypothetical protein